MTIGKKLVFGFGSVVAITVALGATAYVKMHGVVTESADLQAKYVPQLTIASAISGATGDIRIATRSYALTGC